MGDFEATNPDFAAQVRGSFARQAFMAYLGAELAVVVPGRCEIRLAHRPEITQQHGYIHGGAVGAIVDSAMGYAGYSLAPPGATVLTVEYKLNLVAPASGEGLIARGEVVRAGRTLSVCRGDVVAVTGGDETLCATATQTLMILENRSDGPDEHA